MAAVRGLIVFDVFEQKLQGEQNASMEGQEICESKYRHIFPALSDTTKTRRLEGGKALITYCVT